MGIFCVLAFAFGLTGGILTLKRRLFPLAIFGTSLVLASGFVIVMTFAMGPFYAHIYPNWAIILLFALPILVLSILSVVFTAISKGEFT
jgi:hypothetical protein